MKYKIGDQVRIKGVDWYNKNKDEEGYVKGAFFDKSRVKFCGTTQTIDHASAMANGTIIYAFVGFYEFVGEEAIEGLVGEEKIARAVMDKQVERDQLYQECLDAVPEDIKERVNLEVEFSNLVSLVKKMRKAQDAFNISVTADNIEDIDFWHIRMLDLEREVDEYLKKMGV